MGQTLSAVGTAQMHLGRSHEALQRQGKGHWAHCWTADRYALCAPQSRLRTAEPSGSRSQAATPTTLRSSDSPAASAWAVSGSETQGEAATPHTGFSSLMLVCAQA